MTEPSVIDVSISLSAILDVLGWVALICIIFLEWKGRKVRKVRDEMLREREFQRALVQTWVTDLLQTSMRDADSKIQRAITLASSDAGFRGIDQLHWTHRRLIYSIGIVRSFAAGKIVAPRNESGSNEIVILAEDGAKSSHLH